MTPSLANALIGIASMKEAACVLMLREGMVLAVSRRNKNDQWGFPGGKRDPGETTMMAGIREVREEIGFQLDQEVLVPLFSDSCAGHGPLDTYWVTTYLAVGEGPKLSDLMPEEGLLVQYMPLTDLCYRANSPFANYNLGVGGALFRYNYLGVPR